MKDIDNIEDWYREELNNYNVEPDKNAWDSLSEELDASTPLTDENISEWYKKEVSKLEERPDYTVWEKLSTRLDTASVWDRLSLSLSRYDQLIWWRNLAFRGTAIFLLLFGSYLAYNNYANDENTIAVSTNSATKETTTNSATKKAATNIVVSNGINGEKKHNPISATKGTHTSLENETEIEKNVADNSISLNDNAIPKKVSPEKENKNDITESNKKITAPAKNRSRSKENNPYPSMKKIHSYYSSIYIDNLDELKTTTDKDIVTDINRHQLTERDISYLYSSGDFLVKKNNNKIIFNSKRFSSYFTYGLYARRIYLGFNAGVKKQGMITKLKKDSPLAAYKQNSLLDFGTNLGATIGFIVSDNFNIEANVNLNSTSGYKRAFNSEGVSYKENLNLNYTGISILAKKMNNKSTFDNKVYSTNLIGGIYANYLRSAVSDVNGVSRSLDEYNKTDFGIVLGIEQDRYITKTFVITPGIRYNQGLTNNANENSAFESSRNFSFEFNLGVKYIFLKKGK